MKTIVLDLGLLEEEIRPDPLLDEYRSLLAQDVAAHLLAGPLAPCPCPGCRSEASSVAFEKMGLVYRECPRCASLYVSPRPSEAALVDFYRRSAALRFWRERILTATREARRAKLARPRAQWVLDVVDRYRPVAERALVVGYHGDLLVEALLRRQTSLVQIVAANPVADLEFAGRRLPGVAVRPTPVGELAGLGPVDLVLAFDLLDRSADLEALFAALRAALAPGGLLLATTTLSSGFDFQVLWERAKGVYPPERLNLLSIEGLTGLCERYGFELLELSTPGVLDVEVVRHAVRAAPEAGWPRFIRYVVEHRGDEALSALQEYLQAYRLSSFGRVAARRSS